MKRRELITGLAGSAAALTLASRLRAQGENNPNTPNNQNGTNGARPNILWLTIEDTSAHEFGCYGNPHVQTPTIDGLAARGTLFERAWAAGPQCSPSRSSIITGSNATTYGTEWHRRPFPIPEDHFFPLALRAAGYYCTNNPKADYNATTPPGRIWNEHGRQASYNSPRRQPGQPFFAVFNTEITHMGRVRSFDLEGRRAFPAHLDPAKLQLPAYLPDLPEVRSDYAFHLEGVQDVDAWVEVFLRDLKAKGLDEDTIVFFYSDHGGISPRGKGFVYETGLRVPLIAYVPPKFRHLCRIAPGTRSDRLVGLVDMGPTVLSLAGVTPPARMQGRAIMGRHEAAPREFLFGFSANQVGHFQPARAVTDGRFKLFRAYTPHKPLSLRNGFQWGMPANLAWDDHVLSGQGVSAAAMQPYQAHRAERLFDLQNDPWEINDLSAQPQHRATLDRLSRAMDDTLRETADLGLFPAAQRGKRDGLYAWTRATNYPLAELHEAALVASRGDAKNIGKLTAYLRSDKPEIRFWGASGFATLGGAPSSAQAWTPPAELLQAVNDSDDAVASEAAHALCYANRADVGLPALLDAFGKGSNGAKSALETLSLTEAGRQAMQPHLPRLRRLAGDAPAGGNAGGGEDDEGNNVSSQARGILINLRAMPVDRLFGAPEQAKGREVNAQRRPLLPRP